MIDSYKSVCVHVFQSSLSWYKIWFSPKYVQYTSPLYLPALDEHKRVRLEMGLMTGAIS